MPRVMVASHNPVKQEAVRRALQGPGPWRAPTQPLPSFAALMRLAQALAATRAGSGVTFAQALDVLQPLTADTRYALYARLAQAACHLAQGTPSAAYRLYTDADPLARLGRALTAYALGHHDEAQQLLAGLAHIPLRPALRRLAHDLLAQREIEKTTLGHERKPTQSQG